MVVFLYRENSNSTKLPSAQLKLLEEVVIFLSEFLIGMNCFR